LQGISILCISIIVFQFSGCNESNPIQPEQGNVIPSVSGNIANFWGEVRAGVKVSTDSATTYTDAQGNFTFTNVTIPYNVYIMDSITKSSYSLTNLTGSTFKYFQRLTPYSSFTNQCKLKVTVSGNSLQPGVKAKFIFTDDEYLNAYGNTGVDEYIRLRNYSNVTGTLHLIGYKFDQNGYVTSYENYGKKPATLMTGGDVTINFDSTEISFNPTESSISGVYTNTSQNADVGLMTFNFSEYDTPNYATAISFSPIANNNSFDYVVPGNLPGNFKIRLYNQIGGNYSKKWTTLQAGSSGAILEMPFPPLIVEPVNGATVNATTTFKFNEVSGSGFYIIRVFSLEYEYTLISNSTEFTLNDFSKLGINMNSGSSYSWQVLKIGEIDGVNSYVQNPMPLNRSESSSEVRTFTIQ